jgi:hypothetical protein
VTLAVLPSLLGTTLLLALLKLHLDLHFLHPASGYSYTTSRHRGRRHHAAAAPPAPSAPPVYGTSHNNNSSDHTSYALPLSNPAADTASLSSTYSLNGNGASQRLRTPYGLPPAWPRRRLRTHRALSFLALTIWVPLLLWLCVIACADCVWGTAVWGVREAAGAVVRTGGELRREAAVAFVSFFFS